MQKTGPHSTILCSESQTNCGTAVTMPYLSGGIPNIIDTRVLRRCTLARFKLCAHFLQAV